MYSYSAHFSVDSVDKLRHKLDYLRSLLDDHVTFKNIYRYAFDFARVGIRVWHMYRKLRIWVTLWIRKIFSFISHVPHNRFALCFAIGTRSVLHFWLSLVFEVYNSPWTNHSERIHDHSLFVGSITLVFVQNKRPNSIAGSYSSDLPTSSYSKLRLTGSRITRIIA